MKKLLNIGKIRAGVIIAILMFLSSFTIINAQDITNKFRIGLSASLEKNLSPETIAFSQYTGYFADYDKTNYRFGLDLEYGLKSDLTINISIHYSNKNFTGTYFCHVCDLIPPGPEDIDFSFIEVPITMKYYFLPGKIRLFGEAGLNNFFALNDLDYNARANSFATGFKIGGGMEYNVRQEFALQLKIIVCGTQNTEMLLRKNSKVMLYF
jgi:opacity protein-like surface antigen